jgi:transcriptional regulator with XRE-family HTH domain
MAAVALASVADRDVVRCLSCNLTQFVAGNNLCRKCHQSLEPAPEPEPIIAMAAPESAEPVGLAATIKAIRLRKGFSQRELATRLGVPRTYCSKCETGRTTPTLHSLERLARGLEVTVSELLGGVENRRTDVVRELVTDPYVAEMLPFLSKLDGLQLRIILVQVSLMVAKVRRTA